MRIPADAIRLARRFEGLRLTPYLCPAGYPTIGWGHVITSLDHPAITPERADQLLELDLRTAMRGALRYCPRLVSEPEERLAALTDFVFNLGAGRLRASTLRRRVNEGDWHEAAYELTRWVYAGARRLPGLVLRRKLEAALARLEAEGSLLVHARPVKPQRRRVGRWDEPPPGPAEVSSARGRSLLAP